MIVDVIRFRNDADKQSCYGWIFVNKVFECYSLEDFDRYLDYGMKTEEIKNIKIHGRTAIPVGIYQVSKHKWSKNGLLCPLLNNVPGYAGILMHPGNKHDDTDGCILPGRNFPENGFIANSKVAFDLLALKMFKEIDRGGIVNVVVRRIY